MLWVFFALSLVGDVDVSTHLPPLNPGTLVEQVVEHLSEISRQSETEVCGPFVELTWNDPFLSQYWPTKSYWTDRTNQEWYILVYLWVQLSFRELILTLQLKGCVFTSVMLCYQPSFEATLQVMNVLRFIVYFAVMCCLDYCELTQDGQFKSWLVLAL